MGKNALVGYDDNLPRHLILVGCSYSGSSRRGAVFLNEHVAMTTFSLVARFCCQIPFDGRPSIYTAWGGSYCHIASSKRFCWLAAFGQQVRFLFQSNSNRVRADMYIF